MASLEFRHRHPRREARNAFYGNRRGWKAALRYGPHSQKAGWYFLRSLLRRFERGHEEGNDAAQP